MFADIDLRFRRPHRLVENLYHPDFRGGSQAIPTATALRTLARDIFSQATDLADFSHDENLRTEVIVGTGLLFPFPDPLTNRGIFLFRSSGLDASAFCGADFSPEKDITLLLNSTTSLQSQSAALSMIFSHELGHLTFDNADITRGIIGNIPFASHLYRGFYHHQEYRADAFGAEVIGKEQYLETLVRYKEESVGKFDGLKTVFSGTHPSWAKKIRAIEKDSYREIMLESLEKSRDAIRNGERQDSWKDYLANRDTYLSAQRNI